MPEPLPPPSRYNVTLHRSVTLRLPSFPSHGSLQCYVTPLCNISKDVLAFSGARYDVTLHHGVTFQNTRFEDEKRSKFDLSLATVTECRNKARYTSDVTLRLLQPQSEKTMPFPRYTLHRMLHRNRGENPLARLNVTVLRYTQHVRAYVRAHVRLECYSVTMLHNVTYIYIYTYTYIHAHTYTRTHAHTRQDFSVKRRNVT